MQDPGQTHDSAPDGQGTAPSGQGAAPRPRTLLAASAQEFEAEVLRLGGRTFHARSARAAVLQNGLSSYAGLTSLPARLRAALEAELPIFAGAEIDRRVAPDGTTKLLLEFAPDASGRAGTVETVHIPSHAPAGGVSEGPAGAGSTVRGATLCVSTQVGCPVGCPFCASGRAGLVRNLEPWEILEQYVRGLALGPLSRSVVMGLGEPLLNLSALCAALDVVHDEIGIGARKVTVSTVGFPERLRRAARNRPRFQLAISLHTPDDAQRDDLVPAMRGVPIEDVLAAGDDWFEVTGREVTYEIALLAGCNDSPGHAQRLAARLRGRRCTVNLIPYNPIDAAGYRRPSAAAVEAFRAALVQAGIVATVRWSRGLESDAACGQLRVRSGR